MLSHIVSLGSPPTKVLFTVFEELDRTGTFRTIPGQPLTPDMIKEDKIANTHYGFVYGFYSCRKFRLSGKERSIRLRSYPSPKMSCYPTTK